MNKLITIRDIKIFFSLLNDLIIASGGINAYLLVIVFILFSILFAKIILKFCNKSTKEYKNLSIYICIGIIETTILKVLKFDLKNNYCNFFSAIIINVFLFIIFKKIINKKTTK